MCKYCDYNSDDCVIYQDSASSDWYLDIQTYEWDNYNDGYVHQQVFINYCPYCGESLYKKEGK